MPRTFSLKIVAILCAVMFMTGWGLSWLRNVKVPKEQRTAIAREDLDIKDRTRRGYISEVTPTKLTITLAFASDQRLIGTTETYEINPLTNVMVGPDFVNEPGITPGVVAWFEVGDKVEIIQKKEQPGRAVLLRRELRSGENPVFSMNDAGYRASQLEQYPTQGRIHN